MNIKDIKLSLTIELLNNTFQGNIIPKVKDLLTSFQGVGSFLDLNLTNRQTLNDEHDQKNYSLQFENVTLNLQVVSHKSNSCQFVSGFDLR